MVQYCTLKTIIFPTTHSSAESKGLSKQPKKQVSQLFALGRLLNILLV